MNHAFSNLGFGAPAWLWALGLLPVLGAMFFWAEARARRRLKALLPNSRLRQGLVSGGAAGRRGWRHALLLAGLAGLVLAMAEPRMGYEVRETRRHGLDLVLIVDVSKSMLATDVPPDRLRRAKLSVQDILGELGGDRVGLVAFAGRAFLQAPLTVDYDAVLNAAAELDTNLIPLGGTNLGAAIDLAVDAFGKTEAGNRAIILLSDGEPTSDAEAANGVQAAGRAAAAGVKIFTVGMGTPEGSLIPVNGNSGEFVRDEDGKIVRSRLDESNLRELAKVGNGFYVRFTSGTETMHAVVTQGLSRLKGADIGARTDRRPIERYQWPLGVGLGLIVWSLLVDERRKVRGLAAANPPRRAPGRPAASPVTVAGLVAIVAGIAAFAPSAGAGEPAAAQNPVPGAPDDGALELYRRGHFEEAYRAFQDLAKKNPGVASLDFDAGASAYMGKQYDEALDAFGHALTTDNPDLRAKSHYNFGNALFRRGDEQKDHEAKIRDWKNAVQHYNSTLDMLKAKGGNTTLFDDAAYNRDLVQKRLDEEMKQPPPPPSTSSPQKQPPLPHKPDPKDPSSSGQSNSPQDQPPGQQNKEPSSGGKDPQGGPPPPSPQNSSGKPSDDEHKNADQTPKPEDGRPSSHPGQTPDPSSLPPQDQPRPHGDFQSHPNGTPPGPAAAPAEPAEEAGKMSPDQARALLDALKGEDDAVSLHGTPGQPKSHDEPVVKDW